MRVLVDPCYVLCLYLVVFRPVLVAAPVGSLVLQGLPQAAPRLGSLDVPYVTCIVPLTQSGQQQWTCIGLPRWARGARVGVVRPPARSIDARAQ